MPEEEECPHGMGDRAWCVLCNGRAKAEEEVVCVTGVFKARYANWMQNKHCVHYVNVGESIYALSDGCFVCSDCAEEYE